MVRTARKVIKVAKEMKVHKALKVIKVAKEIKVHKALKVIKVAKVIKVHKVNVFTVVHVNWKLRTNVLRIT